MLTLSPPARLASVASAAAPAASASEPGAMKGEQTACSPMTEHVDGAGQDTLAHGFGAAARAHTTTHTTASIRIVAARAGVAARSRTQAEAGVALAADQPPRRGVLGAVGRAQRVGQRAAG